MKKQGRNEMCNCGSGKKFKVCCLQKELNRKKSYGEVLTPVKLVNEMLDTLPESSFELGKKVLDPATGRNAIYPIEYFKRVVKHNIERFDYEYICKEYWENMIYMVEIQKDAIDELQKNIYYFIEAGRHDLQHMYGLDPNETIKDIREAENAFNNLMNVRQNYEPVKEMDIKKLFSHNYEYIIEHIHDKTFNFIFDPDTKELDIDLSEKYNQVIWDKKYRNNHIRICNDGFIIGIHKRINRDNYVEVDLQTIDMSRLCKILKTAGRMNKLKSLSNNS